MQQLADDPAVRDRGRPTRIIAIIRTYAISLWNWLTLWVIGGSPLIPTQLRWIILRLFRVRLARCGIAARVRITTPNMTVGRNTFINMDCFFDTSEEVQIGQECAIGPRCIFITSSHVIGPGGRRAGARRSQGIVVGDGVWIGAGVMALPGISIDNGAVIAAGAVVTHDCQSNTLYAGVPAKAVRTLT